MDNPSFLRNQIADFFSHLVPVPHFLTNNLPKEIMFFVIRDVCNLSTIVLSIKIPGHWPISVIQRGGCEDNIIEIDNMVIPFRFF